MILRNLFPEQQQLHASERFVDLKGDHGQDQKQDSKQDLICMNDIAVQYRQHVALEKINGCFQENCLTAIIGPNGGGKSTLLKAILGMVPLHSGSITLHKTLRGNIAYLPQQNDLDRSFPLTVQDVVASGHCQHEGFFKGFGKGLQEKVEMALDEVGMLDCMNRALDELSGGQFQRVLFARLSLQDADCILMDEPFTAIDTYTVNDLIKVIQKWHKAGKTLLVVNHDLDLVQDHFPTTIMVARRVLDWGDTKDIVTLENLRHAKNISRHLESPDHPITDKTFERIKKPDLPKISPQHKGASKGASV